MCYIEETLCLDEVPATEFDTSKVRFGGLARIFFFQILCTNLADLINFFLIELVHFGP